MADELTRIESFPFDSRFDGYDDDGYPVYDRAVGAAMMQTTFGRFFTDGIFGKPANAWQIRPSSGLSVTVDPGVAIINGAMGAVYGDPVPIRIADAPPQGKIAYGIYLRFDGNDEYRSIYLRMRASEPGSNPLPPVPESGPSVKEYRLGYVTVPSGAANLDDATVTMERGSSVCPYAAPFEEIDVSEIVADVRSQALKALAALQSRIDTDIAFIESAVDGSAAGQINIRLNALENPLRLTRSQLRYYLGFDTEEPADWQDGWQTYAQSQEAENA